MANVLQGGGGTLTEEDRNKYANLFTSSAGGPLVENAIQAGSKGNASAPLASYLSNTSTDNPVISYLPPHLRSSSLPKNGEGSSYDGVTNNKDPNDSNSDGIPDVIVTYGDGAGDNPDGMGGEISDVNSYSKGIGKYTSFKDMFDGGGAGKSGVNFEGGPFSKSLNSLGINPVGYNETAATNFETKGDNPSGGTGDTSFGGGIGTGGFEGYSGGEGPAGGASNDGTSGTGGYGMFNKGGNVVCPKCGKANCGCGYSQGGHVQYRPQGGSIWDTEEDLQILQPTLPQAQRRNAPAVGGSGGSSLLSQAGGMATGMIMKAALTPILGPFAALFNQGGSVKSAGPLSNREMKIESHIKNEARKDMKFKLDEQRKQQSHLLKLKS